MLSYDLFIHIAIKNFFLNLTMNFLILSESGQIGKKQKGKNTIRNRKHFLFLYINL